MSSSMLMETYERNPSNSSKASTGLIEEIVNLHPNSSLPSNDEEGSPDEMITTVLALLGSIMELGSFRRSDNEEKILRSVILPALQTIAGHDSDASIREMASDVALMIMVRGHSSKKKERSESLPPDESKGFLAVNNHDRF